MTAQARAPGGDQPRLGGYDAPDPGYDAARYVVLPVPLEQTTSYMRGTADGPRALLDASTQVELFDEECGDTHLTQIHTLPTLRCTSTAAALDEIKDAAARLFRDGKVPLALGGEHTVTAPMVAALHDTLGPCGVIIFDAHADLRDTYEDSSWSHACVTRRLHDLPGMTARSIIQIGIRSLSREEYDYARDRSLLLLPPCDPSPELLDRLPIAPRTYISIDLDGIDPGESPAVGTPEPGGLTYRQQLAWLAALAARTEIVGFDIVELCPRPGTEHGAFLAARLAYKCIAYHVTRGVRRSLAEYSLPGSPGGMIDDLAPGDTV